MMKQTALLLLIAASVDASSTSRLRQRQLWGSSSSSSGSGWSFWGSILQLLDNMHTPCPPGSLHHKDEKGEPLPPGQCWQDLHKHHHHAHKKSGGGGGGGGGSSSSSYSFIECQQGDANCYQNIACQEGDANCYLFVTCANDDQDCMTYITCDDDSSNCVANVQPNGWSDDGHAATDDAAVVYDDAWSDDGWTANAAATNNASYATSAVQNSSSTPVWPFLVAALVAGVVGVMFVVSRRKRRSDAEESLNETATTTKSRKRLFNFGRKKKGSINDDFDNEDNYVEMSR
ncbi:hypothetical protein ACHAWO_011925 [Cyclotella atomus]|jgi:hypothetical protein|uniref:Uncharacterized protein n=1 Tax=Cyclotella atomus TaxID=382360 RepID=A0ABD3P6H7_9STRA